MGSLGTGPQGHGGGKGTVDSRHLLQLAQDMTPAGRYALTNAVSQLFEHDELNEMEHRLVLEIMMSLIHRAELDLREALAERLSVLKNVPPEVVIFLANDEISVARPVLQHSPVLNDVDLVYIISSKGAEHWQSIAKREQLSPAVVGRLIDTGDTTTAVHLADNPRIVLPRNIVKRLIKTSLKDEKLQTSLLRRPEIDENLAIDLYACVSQVLRREITQRYRIPPAIIEIALDNLVEELSLEARGEQNITPEMLTLSKRFKERNEITPVLMIKNLRRGQISFFIALFAEKIGLSADLVIKLIKKDGGKPFAVACRAVGMMKSEFATIYLLTRPVRTEEKVVDQRELAEALKYYDTVKDSEVQRLKKEWVKNPNAI